VADDLKEVPDRRAALLGFLAVGVIFAIVVGCPRAYLSGSYKTA
jgi:hypothetical protein